MDNKKIIEELVIGAAGKGMTTRIGRAHTDEILRRVFFSQDQEPTNVIDEYVDSFKDTPEYVELSAFAEIALTLFFNGKYR